MKMKGKRMKKTIKLIPILLLSMALVACSSKEEVSVEEYPLVENLDNRKDSHVNIDEEKGFKSLKEDEKEKEFKKLDEIGKDTTGSIPIVNYSNIVPIQTEDEYLKLVVNSNKEPIIIYFATESSSWAQAFTPKLNQLAKEEGVKTYYYDVEERSMDSTYDETLKTYQIDKVPVAYIVRDGKPEKMIHYGTSMKGIESFISDFKAMVK